MTTNDHPSAPDDLRAEVSEQAVEAAWAAEEDIRDLLLDNHFGNEVKAKSQLARALAAALPVLAAGRDGELRQAVSDRVDVTMQLGDAIRELDEARAEVERLRVEVRDLIDAGIRQKRRANEAREQLAVERGKVAAVRDLLDGVTCLDRGEDGANWCDERAVAIPWGTLYRKDQVGPKCAEHLRLRHPDLGALIPGPLSGPAAIVFLSDLHRALADPGQWEADIKAAALREAADRMPAFHDRDVPEWAITSACKWLRARADRVADGGEHA